MKAELDAGGMLTLTAETGTELYALKVWHADLSRETGEPGVPRSSLRVATFVEPTTETTND
jgi:hypothetical protein